MLTSCEQCPNLPAKVVRSASSVSPRERDGPRVSRREYTKRSTPAGVLG